ncbi:MAG: hypothetical protein JJT82_04405 [Legionellaceae bacterium]|nr:hypothetical protein [Legionellaceae bacterium]
MASETAQDQWKTGRQFFSVDGFRQFFLNMKEFPELLFYGAMARQSWYIWLGASPLLLILLPLISVSLAGMAILDIYQLIRAPNKNLDKWLSAFIASVCTVLAGISIFSLVLGTIFGFSFAAGPWFFLSSVSVFFASTVFNMALSLLRSLESPAHSPQQMHFVQRLISQLNMLLTSASVIGSVCFVILFPVSTPLAAAFASACVALTAINIAWRFTPEVYRETIKDWLGFTKPVSEGIVVERINPDKGLSEVNTKLKVQEASGVIPWRFFTAPDYRSQMLALPPEQRLDFFSDKLQRYQQRLEASANPPTRVQSKIAALKEMRLNLQACQEKKPLTAIDWQKFPQIAQSFWRESEMEAMQQAYDWLVRADINHPFADKTPTEPATASFGCG